MNATDNGNGTYTNDDTLYVKDDGHFVEVTEDTTVGGLYTAVDTGDKYVASVEAFETAAPQGGNVTVMNDISKEFHNTTMEYGGTTYPVVNSTPFLNATVDTAIDFDDRDITIESESGQNGINVGAGVSATFSNGTITMNKSNGSSYPVVKADKAEITLDNMTIELTAETGNCISAGSDGGKVIIKGTTVKGPNTTYSNAVFSGSKSTLELANATIIGGIRLEIQCGIDY